MSDRERDEHAALERQQASIAALERGELPLAARERIDELRQKGAAWTSDLWVGEMAAVRHAGFEPVGMVMGSGVFRIAAQWGYLSNYGAGGTSGGRVRTYPCPHGFGYGMGGMVGVGMASSEHRAGYNWEHTNYEAGITGARDAALSRILAEATDIGAHGVVGVRILRRHLEGVGSSLEFTCIGTAIRRVGGPKLKTPFMSTSTGSPSANSPTAATFRWPWSWASAPWRSIPAAAPSGCCAPGPTRGSPRSATASRRRGCSASTPRG